MATIKNVIVAGASGALGPDIVSALLERGFNVSVLSRAQSKASFPDTVTVKRSDYTMDSLVEILKEQDAVVSSISAGFVEQQRILIDAAVAAGVKRFIPSEYGSDTSSPQLGEFFPIVLPKQQTVNYLKSKEGSGLSWTAVVTGGILDWGLRLPGVLGWDIPGRKATIFDGGDGIYEATNLAQVGRAVAALLTPEHAEDTKNKYIYINSFTLTQNKVLSILEELTGDKFALGEAKVAEVFNQSMAALRSGEIDAASGYPAGALGVITAVIYGHGHLTEFSRTKGLWNERLGLPKENLEKTLASIVKEFADKGH